MSIILRRATDLLAPLLLLASVVLLFRGHNHPGGGFVGGLIAASAVSLRAIAYDVATARQRVRVDPQIFVGVGLLLAILSGVIGLVSSQSFLSGEWYELHLPVLGTLDFGTPMLFDIGVYFVVFGVLLMIVLTMAEE